METLDGWVFDAQTCTWITKDEALRQIQEIKNQQSTYKLEGNNNLEENDTVPGTLLAPHAPVISTAKHLVAACHKSGNGLKNTDFIQENAAVYKDATDQEWPSIGNMPTLNHFQHGPSKWGEAFRGSPVQASLVPKPLNQIKLASSTNANNNRGQNIPAQLIIGAENDWLSSEHQHLIDTWRTSMGKQLPKAIFSAYKPNGHWYCDIDTCTGRFQEPIEYPPTSANPIDSNPHGAQDSAVDQLTQEDKAPRCSKGGWGNFHIRPALVSDMEEVADLYNWEVENGFQAMDINPIKVVTFQSIFRSCRRSHLPFLVAIEGRGTTLGENGLTYVSCAWMATGNQQAPQVDQNVIGIALFMPYDRGLDHGWQTGAARTSVKLYVLVDPIFRRQGIGAALLDKSLELMSTRNRLPMKQEWVDMIDKKINNYTRSVLNIYIEVLVKGGNASENECIQQLLQKRLFHLVGYLKNSHEGNKGQQPYSDFLSKKIYCHRCRDKDDLKEV